MLSNSDPNNNGTEDNFFDVLYSEFNIDRIMAPRAINSDGEGRGKISEILLRIFRRLLECIKLNFRTFDDGSSIGFGKGND